MAETSTALGRARESSRAAHIVPFVLFLLFTELARALKIENAELPWYTRAPELWVYPLQCLVCLLALAFWRKHYPFRPWSGRGITLATAAAIVGIAAWLAPTALNAWKGIGGPPWEWLGFVDRRDGFDPNEAAEPWQGLVVFLRFLRLVVVVPLIEEIFWRGFLMRVLIERDGGEEFDQVPFGTFSWRSVIVTTVLFMAVHQPQDYAAALIYGGLTAWIAVTTKSLGACVLMHAIANLILGIYVMQTEFWGLW